VHAARQQGIRTVPSCFQESGNSFQAWARRTQAGQAMTNMATGLGYMGVEERAALCRLDGPRRPAASCRSRSRASERGRWGNVVITMWDWSTNKPICTTRSLPTRNNPTVNANGKDLRRDEESPTGSGARSGEAHRDADPASVPRSGNSVFDFAAEGRVRVLGNEPPWDGHTSIHNR